MRSIPLALIGLLLLAGPAAAADYQILGSSTSLTANRLRTEWTVQEGDNPLNRFKMIRLVKRVPTEDLRGAILLLPALGFSFTFYEQRDDGDVAGTSIAEFFAQRGYDVYGYSPRFDGIPAGVCEAGVLDCSVMATWDLQSIVDDVAFIRSQIELLNPGTGVVVGGLSVGAMEALATVNAHPGNYDGLVLWEGILATSDPTAMALDQAYCAAYEGLLAAGFFYDGVSMNVFKQLGHFAAMSPSGLTPNPLFPPVLSNHQALVAAVSIPDPNQPITMVVPTYVLAVGSLAEDRLLNASDARAFEATRRLYNYYPFALLRDVVCSIAGLDDRHVANLGSFTGPVLGIGAGSGYGPYMEEQIGRLGSADTTFLFEPGFGHLDHFLSARHRSYVERPIGDWLRDVF